MKIEIGNNYAIEKVQDRATKKAVWRTMPGERVTTFMIPDYVDVDEAFLHIVDALPHHMQAGAVPAWIEGDSAPLVKKLCQHYGLLLKDNKRPGEWGSGIPRVIPEENQQ